MSEPSLEVQLRLCYEGRKFEQDQAQKQRSLLLAEIADLKARIRILEDEIRTLKARP